MYETMTLTDKESLWRAILDKPMDDAPRLVYADFLDEHGEYEEAEFIRLQIKLYNQRWYKRKGYMKELLPKFDKEYLKKVLATRKVIGRTRQILASKWREWTLPVRSVLHTLGGDDLGLSGTSFGVAFGRTSNFNQIWFQFERGFIGNVTIDINDFDNMYTILANMPLTKVSLEGISPAYNIGVSRWGWVNVGENDYNRHADYHSCRADYLPRNAGYLPKKLIELISTTRTNKDIDWNQPNRITRNRSNHNSAMIAANNAALQLIAKERKRQFAQGSLTM